MTEVLIENYYYDYYLTLPLTLDDEYDTVILLASDNVFRYSVLKK